MLLTRVAFFAGAVALVGCDDPPLPVAAGAFAVDFRDTGVACDIGSFSTEMGVVESSGNPELVSNGQNNAKAECTIQGSGTFNVNIVLDDAANLQVKIPEFSPDNTEDNPADGTLGFASTETAGDVYSEPSDKPCKFWIEPDGGQFVRAGEAWFTFECEAVEGEGSVCGIATSYIAVRNCLGAVDEEEE